MGYDRGLSAINLEDTDRIPQVEYLYHTAFIAETSGLNPFKASTKALARTYEKLDLDLIFYTLQYYDPYQDEQLKRTSTFIKSTQHWSRSFPSIWRTTYHASSVEDVLNYEPVKEHGGKTVEEVAEYFAYEHAKTQRIFRSQLVPGGYYCTTFMWFIMTFGLELTLKAYGRDARGFERLLNKFAEVSMRDFQAWAQCDIKAFISHDDICMTEGPIFSPQWYRRYVFPWYKRLWKVLKDRGIKVLFCSDGKIDAIVDDIAEAGADGFIVEPWCDLQRIVERWGDNKIIIGNVDLKTLTFKGEDAVRNEVKRCISTAGHCPGYFINVTGSIPDNVPIENLRAYFEACRKYGKKTLVKG